MGDAAALAEKITAVLKTERAALTAGDQDALRQVAETKTALLSDLQRTGLPRSAIARLRVEAARNEALLEAHAAGIRAAMRRIEALSQASAPIASYDDTGARAQIGPAHPEFERRS